MTATARPPARDSAARRQLAVIAALEDGDPYGAIPVPLKPPRDWFEQMPTWFTPPPEGPLVQMAVTGPESGRVAALVAPYSECILDGKAGCWKPGMSKTNYEYAHVGYLTTAEGETIRTANVGGGINHFNPALATEVSLAADHYANTATRRMVGRYVDVPGVGIMFLGMLYPGTTHEQAFECMTSALSGDWRWVESLGDHEMVGAQLVNNPGFRPNPLRPVVLASVSFESQGVARVASLGECDIPSTIVSEWTPVNDVVETVGRRPLGERIAAKIAGVFEALAPVVVDAGPLMDMPPTPVDVMGLDGDDDGEDWADELVELVQDECRHCRGDGCAKCGWLGYTGPDDFALGAQLNEAHVAASRRMVRRERARDGDGDGFVYDSTPRMRPVIPGFDLIGESVAKDTIKRAVAGDNGARRDIVKRSRENLAKARKTGGREDKRTFTESTLGPRPSNPTEAREWDAAAAIVSVEYDRARGRAPRAPQRQDAPDGPDREVMGGDRVERADKPDAVQPDLWGNEPDPMVEPDPMPPPRPPSTRDGDMEIPDVGSPEDLSGQARILTPDEVAETPEPDRPRDSQPNMTVDDALDNYRRMAAKVAEREDKDRADHSGVSEDVALSTLEQTAEVARGKGVDREQLDAILAEERAKYQAAKAGPDTPDGPEGDAAPKLNAEAAAIVKHVERRGFTPTVTTDEDGSVTVEMNAGPAGWVSVSYKPDYWSGRMRRVGANGVLARRDGTNARRVTLSSRADIVEAIDDLHYKQMPEQTLSVPDTPADDRRVLPEDAFDVLTPVRDGSYRVDIDGEQLGWVDRVPGGPNAGKWTASRGDDMGTSKPERLPDVFDSPTDAANALIGERPETRDVPGGPARPGGGADRRDVETTDVDDPNQLDLFGDAFIEPDPMPEPSTRDRDTVVPEPEAPDAPDRVAPVVPDEPGTAPAVNSPRTMDRPAKGQRWALVEPGTYGALGPDGSTNREVWEVTSVRGGQVYVRRVDRPTDKPIGYSLEGGDPDGELPTHLGRYPWFHDAFRRVDDDAPGKLRSAEQPPDRRTPEPDVPERDVTPDVPDEPPADVPPYELVKADRPGRNPFDVVVDGEVIGQVNETGRGFPALLFVDDTDDMADPWERIGVFDSADEAAAALAAERARRGPRFQHPPGTVLGGYVDDIGQPRVQVKRTRVRGRTKASSEAQYEVSEFYLDPDNGLVSSDANRKVKVDGSLGRGGDIDVNPDDVPAAVRAELDRLKAERDVVPEAPEPPTPAPDEPPPVEMPDEFPEAPDGDIDLADLDAPDAPEAADEDRIVPTRGGFRKLPKGVTNGDGSDWGADLSPNGKRPGQRTEVGAEPRAGDKVTLENNGGKQTTAYLLEEVAPNVWTWDPRPPEGADGPDAPDSGKDKYPPTPEQQNAIDMFHSGDDMLIVAGAGAGKTATLVQIANNEAPRKGMYLAFGRALKDEAEGRMPRNVTALGFHQLAWRGIVRDNPKLLARLGNKKRLDRKVEAQILGLDDMTFDTEAGPVRLAAPFLAGVVMEGLRRFTQSDVDRPSWKHMPNIENEDFDDAAQIRMKKALEPFLQRAWADVSSDDGKLRFSFDHFLKMYQLSDPNIGVDFVLVDEAQDLAPVLRAIALGQKKYGTQLGFVGDPAQSIFGFTGAENAMKYLAETGAPSAELTKSFRFGPEVARVANLVLDRLPEGEQRLQIVGHDPIESTIGTIDPDDADVILTRTNAKAVTLALELMRSGKKVAIAEQLKTNVIEFAKGAKDLDEKGYSTHGDLAPFSSWDEVKRFVEEDVSGSELQLLVKLVDDFGVDTILNELKYTERNDEDADIVLSTAHTSKGREWDNVVIGDDFPGRDEKTGEPPELSPEEVRLLYVAVTRAKKRLDVDAVDWLFDGEGGGGGVQTTEKGPGPGQGDLFAPPELPLDEAPVVPDVPEAPVVPDATPEAPAAPGVTPGASAATTALSADGALTVTRNGQTVNALNPQMPYAITWVTPEGEVRASGVRSPEFARAILASNTETWAGNGRDFEVVQVNGPDGQPVPAMRQMQVVNMQGATWADENGNAATFDVRRPGFGIMDADTGEFVRSTWEDQPMTLGTAAAARVHAAFMDDDPDEMMGGVNAPNAPSTPAAPDAPEPATTPDAGPGPSAPVVPAGPPITWDNDAITPRQHNGTYETDNGTVDVTVYRPTKDSTDIAVDLSWADNGEVLVETAMPMGENEFPEAALLRARDYAAQVVAAHEAGVDIPPPPNAPGEVIDAPDPIAGDEVDRYTFSAAHDALRGALPVNTEGNPEMSLTRNRLVGSFDSPVEGAGRISWEMYPVSDGPRVSLKVSMRPESAEVGIEMDVPAAHSDPRLLMLLADANPDVFNDPASIRGGDALGAMLDQPESDGVDKIAGERWDPAGWRTISADGAMMARHVDHPGLVGVLSGYHDEFTVFNPRTGEVTNQWDVPQMSAGIKGMLDNAMPGTVIGDSQFDDQLAEVRSIVDNDDLDVDTKIAALETSGAALREQMLAAAPTADWHRSDEHVAAVSEYGAAVQAVVAQRAALVPTAESTSDYEEHKNAVLTAFMDVADYLGEGEAADIRMKAEAFATWFADADDVIPVSLGGKQTGDGHRALTVRGRNPDGSYRMARYEARRTSRDGRDTKWTITLAFADGLTEAQTASSAASQRVWRDMEHPKLEMVVEGPPRSAGMKRLDQAAKTIIASGKAAFSSWHAAPKDDSGRPIRSQPSDIPLETAGGLTHNQQAVAVQEILDRLIPGGRGLTPQSRRSIRVAEGSDRKLRTGMRRHGEPVPEAPTRKRDKVVEEGLSWFPSSWVEALGEHTFGVKPRGPAVSTGTHGSNSTVPDREQTESLLDVPSEGAPDTVAHEFGHTFERVLPGLLDLTLAHLSTRIGPEERPKVLSGFKGIITGYHDEIRDEYAKKVYGRGNQKITGAWKDSKRNVRATEYLTTGMETTIPNASRGDERTLGLDPNRDAFILGVLTLFDPTADAPMPPPSTGPVNPDAPITTTPTTLVPGPPGTADGGGAAPAAGGGGAAV